MKKLFSLFSVVLMAMMLLHVNTLPVAAEDPTTYYVKYSAADNEWHWQEGSAWTTGGYSRDLYSLVTYEMKDGDLVIVDTAEGDATLDLGNFNLSNLTIMGTTNTKCIVNVKSVADFYALENSYSIINADVTNAWLFNHSFINFNQNVDYIEIYNANPDWANPPVTFAVGGTLGHLFVHGEARTYYNAYSFTAPVYFEDGILLVSEEYYSTTPPAATQTPAVTTSSTSSASDEYDEVPKTGESNTYLWAFAFAALCFAGSYSLKKRL